MTNSASPLAQCPAPGARVTAPRPPPRPDQSTATCSSHSCCSAGLHPVGVHSTMVLWVILTCGSRTDKGSANTTGVVGDPAPHCNGEDLQPSSTMYCNR